MITMSIASQLEGHRIELGDDTTFVLRCQDGAYGRLVSDVAVDVVAGDTSDGNDPGPAALADAILVEVRQTVQDARPLAA